MVRRWVQSGSYPGYENWGEVYKLCCREENMSWQFGKSKPPKTHPYLKLVPPTDEQEVSATISDSRGCTPPIHDRDVSSGEDEDRGPPRLGGLNDQDRQNIITRILRYTLVFEEDIIHSISRLDPYLEPGSVNLNCNNRMSLLHRFHIGKEPVSLSMGAIHPQRLLAPLLVCREFNMIGSHLFYGANRFAFSSIGE